MGRFGGRHCAGRHRDVCPDNLGLHIGVFGEERGPKGPQSERTAERLKRLLSPSFIPHFFMFLLQRAWKTVACACGPSPVAWRWTWLSLLAFVFITNGAIGQSPTRVDGHVIHAQNHSSCGDALVWAWPCGSPFATNEDGWFDAFCPEGIDSLTVVAHGHPVATVFTLGRQHVDVSLAPWSVGLEAAFVEGLNPENHPESQSVSAAPDFMTMLDRTPGIRSLDLGAGMIQPVLRGLMGTRVAILEDGVPQQGSRWGADHGAIVDPELYGQLKWVPGGGHVWLGPSAMGGGLQLTSHPWLSKNGSETRSALGYRVGDGRAKVRVLHLSRTDSTQWHVGVSATVFGDRNVPQSSFQYLGRRYELRSGRLPNTGGRAAHATAGYRKWLSSDGVLSFTLRASDLIQGLFPGIVGLPEQGDLLGDGLPYAIALPAQQARRIQWGGKWTHPGRFHRTVKWSLAQYDRQETAPPHAHGWGPLPDSDVSLRLREATAFLESKWEGNHGAFGFQFESLRGTSSGWEFLIPNHTRDRISAIGEWQPRKGNIGIRLDGIRVSHDAHTESLYASNGSVIGEDQRTRSMQRFMPSMALTWSHPWPTHPLWSGQWTTAVYTRAPDNYALGGNGIHHGTFRFEQGQDQLNPEKSLEARIQLNRRPELESKGITMDFSGFAAFHDGFIHLAPTARFAPISHAGQVYAFEATDAFRTGMEATVGLPVGRSTASGTAVLLGQWALNSGLGLPFTPPAEWRTSLRTPFQERGWITLRHRLIATSYITARNEESTSGASLFGLEAGWQSEAIQLSLNIDNLLNQAWLDHTSAYRALGLVTQGRWASLQLALNF